jgi:hypothetical protein
MNQADWVIHKEKPLITKEKATIIKLEPMINLGKLASTKEEHMIS